jgi:hypothetical protein
MSILSDAKIVCGDVLFTLAEAVLSACSKQGKVTLEGPSPHWQIDPNAPVDKWYAQAIEIDYRSEQAAIKLYDQFLSEPLKYGRHLEEAILRAKDFQARGVYFANGTHLPGGLAVSNELQPRHAVEVLELAKKNYDETKATFLRRE